MRGKMNSRLQDVIQDTYGNYILPFFWQHGATEETLREYMEKIYDCGIKAVCLEARPHPDFAGEKWWQDVDVVMDEARKRGMRVWILDDSHFPTGYANGAMKDAPDHLKRWYLEEKTLRAAGPLKNCRFAVANHLGKSFFRGHFIDSNNPEELVAVILGRRETADGKEFYTDLQDVTDHVRDGWLYLDLPKGAFNIFIYTRKIGAVTKAADHISFLEKESVRYLIDAVYEKHYEHYKEDFGKTLAGFFSDEPGFYNLAGTGFGMVKIGDPMPLPWTVTVEKLFADRTAQGSLSRLPGLFHAIGGEERKARYVYMDIITDMYEKNFSRQLGDWCQERNVEYIGHVLEDCGVHSRLGPGTGHFFRAMAGQHMGGIDTVLNQLMPNMDYDDRGKFYHYGLGTLSASVAHQNERMQGRAMCELFGAFGWSEGLTMMKWMADHMLVNGVNWFVPHAFTEKEFPDPDCPPHFYAHGFNPQYRYMSVLFPYMNRVAHLLNGGRAVADVAVFFPAEGEWGGEVRAYERIGELCLTRQIPYEVLCMDTLRQAKIVDGRICVGTASYKYLFVDGISYLPKAFLEDLKDYMARGAAIYFVDRVPVATEDGRRLLDGIAEAITTEEVLEITGAEVVCKTEKPDKWLRFYEYQHSDLTVYMMVNASMNSVVDTYVTLPGARMVKYDAIHGKFWKVETDAEGRIPLKLDKGQSVLFLAGEDLPEAEEEPVYTGEEVLNAHWKISIADYDDTENFRLLKETEKLTDVALDAKEFSGIIRYETAFEGRPKAIKLPCCYEAAQVWVNGQSAGTCIIYPYLYDIEALCRNGENELRIEVATTLANAQMDGLSEGRPVEPEGILGDVEVLR